MIRVALVDDEPVAREGLRLWLAGEKDLTVVGEAGSPASAVEMVLREQPVLAGPDRSERDIPDVRRLRRALQKRQEPRVRGFTILLLRSGHPADDHQHARTGDVLAGQADKAILHVARQR